MNRMNFSPPLSAPIPSVFKKRRVLLVDTSHAKRDLRAEVMRRLGIEVDCAADISEALSWWRADLYQLVLINVPDDIGQRDAFCEGIRGARPPQKMAFLVGKPEYLAASPGAEEAAADNGNHDAILLEARAVLSSDLEGAPQRWGILEASRRISAVRSAAVARTQALRNRPAPPRDVEIRTAKRITQSTTLDDLLREELL